MVDHPRQGVPRNPPVEGCFKQAQTSPCHQATYSARPPQWEGRPRHQQAPPQHSPGEAREQGRPEASQGRRARKVGSRAHQQVTRPPLLAGIAVRPLCITGWAEGTAQHTMRPTDSQPGRALPRDLGRLLSWQLTGHPLLSNTLARAPQRRTRQQPLQQRRHHWILRRPCSRTTSAPPTLLAKDLQLAIFLQVSRMHRHVCLDIAPHGIHLLATSSPPNLWADPAPPGLPQHRKARPQEEEPPPRPLLH